MDIFAHTLWTAAGARGTNATLKKKGSSSRIHVGWAAFWGVVPDFFAFTLPFFIGMYAVLFRGIPLREFSHHTYISGIDLGGYLYQYSHSLVIFAVTFIAVWAICRRPRWEMLGWALHILIDIPSHSIEFFPTPFLFPLSDYRFPYGVSWASFWYMVINYSALLLVWGGIFIRDLRKYGFRSWKKKDGMRY